MIYWLVDGIIFVMLNVLLENYILKDWWEYLIFVIFVDCGINLWDSGWLIVKEYEGVY